MVCDALAVVGLVCIAFGMLSLYFVGLVFSYHRVIRNIVDLDYLAAALAFAGFIMWFGVGVYVVAMVI